MTTIEVKNDYMLGIQNENILYYKCMELEQENKQLKEELESKKKMYWQQQCAYYSSILYSLEEWLKEHKNLYEGNEFQNNAKFCMAVDQVLDKIQELKEKYK